MTQYAKIEIKETMTVPGTTLTAHITVKNDNIHVMSFGTVETQVEVASYVADYYHTVVVAEFNGTYMSIYPGIYMDVKAKELETNRFKALINAKNKSVTT